jgi:hypothetical protein
MWMLESRSPAPTVRQWSLAAAVRAATGAIRAPIGVVPGLLDQARAITSATTIAQVNRRNVPLAALIRHSLLHEHNGRLQHAQWDFDF